MGSGEVTVERIGIEEKLEFMTLKRAEGIALGACSELFSHIRHHLALIEHSPLYNISLMKAITFSGLLLTSLCLAYTLLRSQMT